MSRLITEGFDDVGLPTLKYYAFDWDDNLMFMPTKIIVKDDNGKEVEMSTEDFAEYRSRIGKEPFSYKGTTIVGFASDPFRNFGTKGDKQFLLDSMKAKPGPAWADFIEAVNNGSIFSIITARGHNPNTLKEAVFNMIASNHMGINKDLLIKNLRKFRDFVGEDNVKPQEVKSEAQKLGQKVYLKDDVKNRFVPEIGFSDDDIRNVEVMKKHFEDEPSLRTYSTAGGIKTRY